MLNEKVAEKMITQVNKELYSAYLNQELNARVYTSTTQLSPLDA